MVTGAPASDVKVRDTVCEVEARFEMPRYVVQFEVPCGPFGAKGKNSVDGAPEVSVAFVRPMSRPPGNCVVNAALTLTSALMDTKSILLSLSTSPSRREVG